MKTTKCKSIVLAGLLGVTSVLYGGNPQRSGSAGAAELLVNPWARSAGWGGVNIANVRGIESSYINIAGAAFTDKTSVGFANTQFLVNDGISINAAAINQKVSTNGVMVLSINSFDYGSWERTTADNPDGGIGTISPSTAVIGLGYAQKFTESIRGGVNVKLYNQGLVDLSVFTACIDAGVQYVTGSEEQLKLGITLKNVGPAATYRGDGNAVDLPVPQGGYTQAFEQRSASFEIPATLAMGGSYDFLFDQQRLTLAGAFQSNSFEKDRYMVGAEYSMREMLSVRAGYTIFDNRDFEKVTTVFTGLSAGLSFDIPLSKDNSNVLGVDYSYMPTKRFSGVHSIGVNFRL